MGPVLTGRRLLEALQAMSPDALDCPVRVWLPGSYIALSGTPFVRLDGPSILVEGDLEPGSALEIDPSDSGLIRALKRLEQAAANRDATMGDPLRLIEVKAELAAAAQAAQVAIASAEGRLHG